MSEKRFNDKTTNRVFNSVDKVMLMDNVNKVVPPSGGLPVPSLRQASINNLMTARNSGMTYDPEDFDGVASDWVPATTYAAGDIVKNVDVSFGILLHYICVIGGYSAIDPGTDTNAAKVWKPMGVSTGVSISGAEARGNVGLGVGQGSLAGGVGSIAAGGLTNAGHVFEVEDVWKYKGVRVEGSYDEYDMVLYNDVFYVNTRDENSTVPGSDPGNDGWSAKLSAGAYVGLGAYITDDLVRNAVTFNSSACVGIYRNITGSNNGIADMTNTDWELIAVLSEAHTTVTFQNLEPGYSINPRIQLVCRVETDGGVGTTAVLASPLICMSTSKDALAKVGFSSFLLFSNTSEVPDVVMGNIETPLIHAFIAAIHCCMGSGERDINLLTGCGNLSLGYDNASTAIGSIAAGMNLVAQKIGSVILGGNGETVNPSELAISGDANVVYSEGDRVGSVSAKSSQLTIHGGTEPLASKQGRMGFINPFESLIGGMLRSTPQQHYVLILAGSKVKIEIDILCVAAVPTLESGGTPTEYHASYKYVGIFNGGGSGGALSGDLTVELEENPDAYYEWTIYPSIESMVQLSLHPEDATFDELTVTIPSLRSATGDTEIYKTIGVAKVRITHMDISGSPFLLNVVEEE